MVPGPRVPGESSPAQSPPRIGHLSPPPSCQSGAGRGQADTLSLEMVDGVVTVTYCHAESRRVANTGGYLVCDHMPDSQCRLGTGERQRGDGPEVVLGGP